VFVRPAALFKVLLLVWGSSHIAKGTLLGFSAALAPIASDILHHYQQRLRIRSAQNAFYVVGMALCAGAHVLPCFRFEINTPYAGTTATFSMLLLWAYLSTLPSKVPIAAPLAFVNPPSFLFSIPVSPAWAIGVLTATALFAKVKYSHYYDWAYTPKAERNDTGNHRHG
jgi:hypothetical protein